MILKKKKMYKGNGGLKYKLQCPPKKNSHI